MKNYIFIFVLSFFSFCLIGAGAVSYVDRVRIWDGNNNLIVNDDGAIETWSEIDTAVHSGSVWIGSINPIGSPAFISSANIYLFNLRNRSGSAINWSVRMELHPHD